METRIITISRQFGSGGRTIGKEVAAKLGIPCYDQELIEKFSVESGFSREYIQENGEHVKYGSWLANTLSNRMYQNSNTQDMLWNVQRKVILELAQKGSCVIVGRCADYILKDTVDCLRVFIHADMEKRAERIVKVYGENADTPEKRLNDKDKRRKAYYQFYTGCEWGEAKNYHLTLDSGMFGIEKCVDTIVSLY